MKLIQVNEDFWCCASEVCRVEVLRRADPQGLLPSAAFVYLKVYGNDSVDAGFGKHLGDMWGATPEEKAANFSKEVNQIFLASGMG